MSRRAFLSGLASIFDLFGVTHRRSVDEILADAGLTTAPTIQWSTWFYRPVWCVQRDGKFVVDSNGFPKVFDTLAGARGFAFAGLSPKDKRRGKIVEMQETLEPRESWGRKR